MKLAYFCNEIPYPARHGGRVDTWSRLKAMHALGTDIALISWYAPEDHPLPQDTLDKIASIASTSQFFLTKPDLADRLRRLVRLVRWPSHVSARIPLRHERAAFWTRMDAFKPEAVWLDSLYGTVLAFECAKRYNVPVFYRSHNIEHQYMRGQVALMQRWKAKLLLAMNLPHLKRVEFDTLRRSHTCFDISQDDMRWWQQNGLSNMQWLPPNVAQDTAERLLAPLTLAPAYDVGYLGNLRTPNNVSGVLWFLTQAWPTLRALRPATTMVLAGSFPAPAILAAVAQAEGVTLLENAPDASAVLRSARVLVNPIFAGSGVNIKSVEMLFAPGQRVSTSQGVAGLPAHVKQCFQVADEAPAFAQAIQSILDAKPDATVAPTPEALAAARSEFGTARIQNMLMHMQAVCDGRAQRSS